MSATKKSKTSQEAELDAVRQHLLECPNISKDSRALQVALEALDQERKRMERDAKLQRKFASTSNSKSNIETQQTITSNKSSTTAVSASKQQQQSQQQQDDDAELMEWQDVAPSHEQIVEAPLEGSVLGKVLTQSAITDMATSKTTVASPIAAIALALHAALCGDTLGFKCTGIPNEGVSKGFAAPIRELPKTLLVPNDWDKTSVLPENPSVKLRYRKDGVGSTVLNVSLKEENVVHVALAPSGSSKEPHELTFVLSDHVNLDSLSKALESQGRVVPTLHYKALPVLLTNMCNTFDLGPVQDAVEEGTETSSSSSLPYVDTTIVPPTNMGRPTFTSVGGPASRQYDQHEPPNLRMFQPALRRPGDFDRDLMPGGIDSPAGNLMGPNHPAFGGPAIGSGGGYGMRPRFDPYGPPGGPQDPGNDDANNLLDPRNPQRARRPRPPPGGTGDPNPDHERPPNNLSNNMFM